MNSFGTRLAELRKQTGLSQEKFAELLNVSRQFISKWENDKAYPEMTRLIFMSDYFQVSLDELMRGVTDRKDDGVTIRKESLQLKTRGLLQELSNFFSNLSDGQKVKLTFLYFIVMLSLFGILLVVFYVMGKYIGEAVYFLTH